MADVLVIGGGLSGATAAVRLRAAGLSVMQAQAGWGASGQFTGQLCLAASPALSHRVPTHLHPDGDAAGRASRWPLLEQLRDIVRHEPLHPFATLGADASLRHIDGALTCLRQVWAACGVAIDAAPWQQAPRAWPAATGALLPVWASHEPLAAASPADAGPARQLTMLDFAHAGVGIGGRAALAWAHDAGRWHRPTPRVRTVQVPADALRWQGQALQGALSLARAFDDEAFTHSFANALAPALGDGAAVLMPAVLGLMSPGQAQLLLQRRWGVPVHEVLADAPSVPGIRLMRALGDIVRHSGTVQVGPVAHGRCLGNRLVSVRLRDGTELRPRALVLATGRFLTGGLVWPAEGRCHEQLLGLPASSDGGPITERSAMELTRRRPEDDQPLLRAGVSTDAGLRPYGCNGEPMANVWAAGMLLGGFSPQRTHCSDGVALASGHAAAENIAAAFAAGRLAATPQDAAP